MELYLENSGRLSKISSNVKNSITLNKGMKIKTYNIEKARKELSRDVYVIKGSLKETDYGLVVE